MRNVIAIVGLLMALHVQPARALIEIAALGTPDYARDVAVAGDRAYVADGASGLRVIDVSNPALPVRLGSIAIARYAWRYASDVELVGDLVYATGYPELSVIDFGPEYRTASLAVPGLGPAACSALAASLAFTGMWRPMRRTRSGR
jgi:hypothetical protein